jgi:predicted nucleotidyltransferase
MSPEDEQLINRFLMSIVEKVPSIQAAVLYGSMARGDYDKRSDIDIMLIVDTEDREGLNTIISEVITELQPHREIRTVVTDLHDYDEDYYQNVFREGRVLYGKVILTPENLALKPYLILSYDLSGKPNTLQVKVSKRVHGYISKKVIDGEEKIYRYDGIEKKYNGKIISKSAVMLPFDYGSEFAEELKVLQVPFKIFKVWM